MRLVCIHTAEGARTVESLGNYFARSSVKASSHVGIDDGGIEQYVPYSESAWTLRSGNSISDNAELCGFARWSREEWLGQHRGMLDHAADWIAERCRARDIPLRKLTPEQVRRGDAGVIGHHDWTVGMRDGSHTDPGPGFPWDYVMQRAAAQTHPSPPPSPPRAQEDDCMYIKCQPDKSRPEVWVGLLSGPVFVGLGSPGEIGSADGEIERGAPCQWVELGTWIDLDTRSRAICAPARVITDATPVE